MADYYAPPEINSIIGLVDTYLLWKNENESPRGFEHYHPSAWGNCLRKMQYQRYAERGYIPKPTEKIEPQMIRIWDNGHGIHDRWREYFTEIGILRGVWKCSNPHCRSVYGKKDLQGCFKPERCRCGFNHFFYDEISVASKELNFRGHCDIVLDFSRFDPQRFTSVRQSYMMEYLPRGLVVVDMKSINHFDFQEVAKGNPHDYYITQLMIYANIIECDFGVLIYENKNNQKVASFRVDKNTDTDFARVKRQAKEMNEMVEVVDTDGSVHHLLPPPKPKNKEDKVCEYCPFRSTCHDSEIWEDPELPKKREAFYEAISGSDSGEIQGRGNGVVLSDSATLPANV